MSDAPRIPATVTELGRKLILSIWRSQQSRGASDRTAPQWAKQYGVSVACIHRALRDLEARGYVVRISDHGSRHPLRQVVPWAVESGVSSLTDQLHSRQSGVSEASVRRQSGVSEASVSTINIATRAFSPAQPSPAQLSCDTTEPFHLPEPADAPPPPPSQPVHEFFGVPGDLFKQAGDALNFLKRRRKDLFKYRGIGGHAMRLTNYAMAREPATRWYTAVALMRLPPEKPDPALLATVRDVDPTRNALLAPEGIQPDGVILNAFKVLIAEHDNDLRDRCIAANGGDLHSAALQGPERLRSWLALNRPREKPDAAFEAAIAAKMRESAALFGDIDDEPADESEPIGRTAQGAHSARR